MHIGQVAKLTGFSKDTIRWYEKIGLIKLNRQLRESNNYRIYDQSVIERLNYIKQLKSLGFTLKETEDLLIMDDIENLNCTSVSSMIDSKVEAITHQIRKLKTIRSKLLNSKSVCTGNCKEVLTSQ